MQQVDNDQSEGKTKSEQQKVRVYFKANKQTQSIVIECFHREKSTKRESISLCSDLDRENSLGQLIEHVQNLYEDNKKLAVSLVKYVWLSLNRFDNDRKELMLNRCTRSERKSIRKKNLSSWNRKSNSRCTSWSVKSIWTNQN